MLLKMSKSSHGAAILLGNVAMKFLNKIGDFSFCVLLTLTHASHSQSGSQSEMEAALLVTSPT